MKKFLVAILVMVLAFVFVGCTPSSYKAATEKMEKAGYTVLGSEYEKTEDGAVGSFTANIVKLSNLGASQSLTATLYASSKEAKAAYNNTKNDKGETSAVLLGKWVVVGTEDAVKAFKK